MVYASGQVFGCHKGFLIIILKETGEDSLCLPQSKFWRYDGLHQVIDGSLRFAFGQITRGRGLFRIIPTLIEQKAVVS